METQPTRSTVAQNDSYIERRQLFKNIWDTAFQIDEKDTDVLSKPKVIKTLRIDESDKTGKGKKQRLRNLRTVCNKILEFCDRQEADDLFYDQLISDGQSAPNVKLSLKKKVLRKRRVRKVKSLVGPPIVTPQAQARQIASERRRQVLRGQESPLKVKRTTLNRLTASKMGTKRLKNAANNFIAETGKRKTRTVMKKKKPSQGSVSKAPTKQALQLHVITLAE